MSSGSDNNLPPACSTYFFHRLPESLKILSNDVAICQVTREQLAPRMFQIFPITALFFQRARGWIWWNTFHVDFLKNGGDIQTYLICMRKGWEELTYNKRQTDSHDFQSHLWFPGCTLISVTYEAVGGIWVAVFHNTEVPCTGSACLSRGPTRHCS